MATTQTVESLQGIIGSHLETVVPATNLRAIEDDVESSINYLISSEAIASLNADPYWPKWHSPWWHLSLLHELSLSARVPTKSVDPMVNALNGHYLRIFPKPEELPYDSGVTMYIPCHCAVGCMYQVLSGCRRYVDEDISWLRAWFPKYQLPDGGLNCYEAAYSKPEGKSSIISTVPPLEALLYHAMESLTADELEFLDRGAQYLIDHKLCCAGGTNRVLDDDWLLPKFPRFYHYDVLRGLRFLVSWALFRKSEIPLGAISHVVEELSNSFEPGSNVRMSRNALLEMTTRVRIDSSWKHKDKVSSFPLLTSVIEKDIGRQILTGQWLDTLRKLDRLIQLRLIV